MPTYTCTTTAGRLSEEQRLKVVESITATHSEETGAPRYLVQVIFYEVVLMRTALVAKKPLRSKSGFAAISGADAQKPLSETCWAALYGTLRPRLARPKSTSGSISAIFPHSTLLNTAK
jgi:phenylpyruvate tautomerase PptA (4-oxalocrotonate tautomerase family)